MATYRETLSEAMDILAEGTRLRMRRLFRGDPPGFVGKLNNLNGWYSLTDTYGDGGGDSGFLLGRLWLLHLHTSEDQFKDWALRVITPCVEDLTERTIQTMWPGLDIYNGMCWTSTILKSDEWKDLAVKATRNLINSLWSERAQIFMSGPTASHINIDAPLRFQHIPWCAKEDPELMKPWIAHFDTLIRHGVVRPDGSTYQILRFDPETHAFVCLSTTQGWRPESTWARGQAWGMHNFTSAYESTGLQRFLDSAVKQSDWWVEHIREDGIAYYDFDDPDRFKLPLDTCASAIAVNAMIRLCRIRPELSSRYRPVIERTLVEIAEHHLSPGGLVVHGTWANAVGRWSRPLRWPQEDIMPYSNYYYVEALYRELTDDWSLFELNPDKR